MKPSVSILVLLLWGYVQGELLTNGGFETLDPWSCYNFNCVLVNDKHSGQHAMKVSHRTVNYQGPSQIITVEQGKTYQASGYIKLLIDQADHMSQRVAMELELRYQDGTKYYQEVAAHPPIKVADGWVQLRGQFAIPTKQIERARVYYQGPIPSVSFLVDDASVTELKLNHDDHTWRNITDQVIRTHRMSNIRINVTTAATISNEDVQIQVIQKKKSFPFGSAVSAVAYNDPSQVKYRDFIGKHFNWAVPENALKWKHIEPRQGHKDYQQALDTVHGLKKQGLKVRGHNLVWSKEPRIQSFVQAMSGDALRQEIKNHIEETMNKTRGLLQHWDVNNEMLHGTWYQDRLHDPDYNLELFRIAHHADPRVKLFLNDYQVVADGALTEPYLAQARHFKSANVGLYGIGVQCHFHDELEPNPYLIKQRLDLLAQAGLPIWVTELDVGAEDENKRADFYEKALKSFYGHPAVEGILFWGFWDQKDWRGEKAALVRGPNLELTAAGRRVLDLFENQWMTDETHVLSHSGHRINVLGFHGDYEVHVRYQGHERKDLVQTFTLSPGQHTHTVSISVN
ncbi:uncharacterized protein [Littorina saxatilis]|uniref:GH10 domain-containing protein n=1 Tax=Littorina saxatilis TaxID=31220 RepID=A0AAN9BFH5_9CAEN